MTDKKNWPIGVFDSGLGGLTVARELMKQLPHESLIYVGDTARVPYGAKSPETIRKYALQISFFLLQKKVKALVVACNSVSAVALKALKDLPIPVVGVIVPGAKAAFEATRHGRVGVIGTKATIASGAYQEALHHVSSSIRVVEAACPLFVPLVEEGWLNHSVTQQVAEAYLKPFLRQRIDTLVLGCTHYPLLKPVLKKVVGPHVRLIDSAEETAKAVRLTLENKNLMSTRRSPKLLFYVTDAPKNFTKLSRQFFGPALPSARLLRMENF